MPEQSVLADKDVYIFQCPHCLDYIIVGLTELNCHIFRHGADKDNTNNQIDPHAPKEVCTSLVDQEKIYGCGKPFRIIDKDGQKFAVECEYI